MKVDKLAGIIDITVNRLQRMQRYCELFQYNLCGYQNLSRQLNAGIKKKANIFDEGEKVLFQHDNDAVRTYITVIGKVGDLKSEVLSRTCCLVNLVA